MRSTTSTALSLLLAAGFALSAATASYAASTGAKRFTPPVRPAVRASILKLHVPTRLKGNQTAAEARECTWTNDNIALCSEMVGDTMVITCFDHNGNSIGC